MRSPESDDWALEQVVVLFSDERIPCSPVARSRSFLRIDGKVLYYQERKASIRTDIEAVATQNALEQARTTTQDGTKQIKTGVSQTHEEEARRQASKLIYILKTIYRQSEIVHEFMNHIRGFPHSRLVVIEKKSLHDLHEDPVIYYTQLCIDDRHGSGLRASRP